MFISQDSQPKIPTDPDLRNPYSAAEVEEQDALKRHYSAIAQEAGTDDYIPVLKSLDNGMLCRSIALFTNLCSQALPSSYSRTPKLVHPRTLLSARGKR